MVPFGSLIDPGYKIALFFHIIAVVLLGATFGYGKGSQFFIVWGFVAIIALFGVQHGFFAPQMAKLQELAERDLVAGDSFSAEFDATSQKIAQVGAATGLLIVVTMFIMAYKPFL